AVLEDDGPGEVAGPVGVVPAGLGAGHGEALGADEVGERVQASGRGRVGDQGAPDPVDVVGQSLREFAEDPGDPSLAGDADGPVAVLHRRVRLGPRAGGLPHLQRGLQRQAAGPAAAQEGELFGSAHCGAEGFGEGPLGVADRVVQGPYPGGQGTLRLQVGAEQREVGKVANRVWTTDSSSAKSRTATASAARVTGDAGSAVTAPVAMVPRTRCSRPSTSVVVPDRVIARTRSQGLPYGNSEAA